MFSHAHISHLRRLADHRAGLHHGHHTNQQHQHIEYREAARKGRQRLGGRQWRPSGGPNARRPRRAAVLDAPTASSIQERSQLYISGNASQKLATAAGHSAAALRAAAAGSTAQ